MNHPLVRRPLAAAFEGEPDVLGLDQVGVVANLPALLPCPHQLAGLPRQPPRLGIVGRCRRCQEELALALHGRGELRVVVEALLQGVVVEGVRQRVAFDEGGEARSERAALRHVRRFVQKDGDELQLEIGPAADAGAGPDAGGRHDEERQALLARREGGHSGRDLPAARQDDGAAMRNGGPGDTLRGGAAERAVARQDAVGAEEDRLAVGHAADAGDLARREAPGVEGTVQPDAIVL